MSTPDPLVRLKILKAIWESTRSLPVDRRFDKSLLREIQEAARRYTP